jgi:ATP-binding cassette subfamily B protein
MTSPSSEEPLPIGPKEELPEEIQEEFDSISEPEEDIRVAVSSDMDLDGVFEDCWLLATDKRILVFSGNHYERPELIYEVPIADVNEVRLKNYIGNGILEVEIADKTVELLRFSKTAFHKNDIADIPRAIDRLREQSGQKVEKRKGRDHEYERGHGRGHRCEKCGNIIPRWSGTCPHCLEKRTLLARLFSYLKPYWPIAVIAFVLSLSTTGLRLIPTYITKLLTDQVFVPAVSGVRAARDAGVNYIPEPGLFSLLNVFVLAIIGAYVLSTGLGTIRTYMMRWLGNKVIFDLRTSAYEYLQRLSLSFYNKKETGRLMSRISYDTGRLQDFIVRGIQDFIMDIFMLVGMCVILFVTNWRLAALTLIPIPALTVGSIIFGKKMHVVYHKVWRRMAGISAILADTIPGVRVVKAFVAEDREVDRFNDKNISNRVCERLN